MRHGAGRFYYQDGGMYDGEWLENKMCGKGKLYYQSGTLAYDGYWRNDQFQGPGRLCNEMAEILEDGFDCRDFNGVGEYWKYYEGNCGGT
jgi:hypothetical protein